MLVDPPLTTPQKLINCGPRSYPPDFYPRIHKRLVAMGKEAGIAFKHDASGRGGKLVVNTLNSLRLIDYAQSALPVGAANELVEAVIFAHHVHGIDISDAQQLAALGAGFGLKEEPLHAFIADPEAFAPKPGSVEAKAAIAPPPKAAPALLTCGDDGACGGSLGGQAGAAEVAASGGGGGRVRGGHGGDFP